MPGQRILSILFQVSFGEHVRVSLSVLLGSVVSGSEDVHVFSFLSSFFPFLSFFPSLHLATQLKCSGTISATATSISQVPVILLPQPPRQLGSQVMAPHPATSAFLVETGFNHVAQADLELLTSGDSLA